MEEKFCKFCGERIPLDAVICTKCGRQVENFGKTDSTSPIIINNNNSASSSAAATASTHSTPTYQSYGRRCSKWVALLLCLFLGFVGGHKFYEGKIGLGIVYVFTCGLFFLGTFIDFFNILGKPDPYYVN